MSKKVISPGSSSIVLDGAKSPWVVYRQKSTTADTFADRGVAIDPVTIDAPAQSMTGKPTRGVVRPAAFVGQFIQMDVVSVVAAP